ncbi:hypothetical protein ABZ669_09145 [Streptomyces hirsutus]|uniref:hypothetical protein n=1 Tax=Streptomyces hirsutus TaxID=35620 RepID=UPI003409C56F
MPPGRPPRGRPAGVRAADTGRDGPLRHRPEAPAARARYLSGSGPPTCRARPLLAHARGLLPDDPQGELRYLAECLTEALADALRVAESRGRRPRGLV